jgi:hypothetical protein
MPKHFLLSTGLLIPYGRYIVEMKHVTALGITAIVAVVVVGNVVSVVMGQEMSEIEKVRALSTELKAYGYSFERDVVADGSQIEFRSNGTIEIQEDTLGDMITKYGFSLIEFAPAPVGQDSIIIVGVRA